MTSAARLLFVTLVACTAANYVQALALPRDSPFPSTVYVDMSAFLDFLNHRLLFKLVTEYRKVSSRHDQRTVVHAQDYCFWDISGDMNVDKLGNAAYRKVAAMLKEMFQNGTRKGTMMMNITDNEWLEMPHTYQDECTKETTFIVKSRPKCGPVCQIHCPHGYVIDERGCRICQCNPGKPNIKATSASARSLGAEETNAVKPPTVSVTKHQMHLEGCIQQRQCRADLCQSEMGVSNICSRAKLECAFYCRKTAIAFRPSNSSTRIIEQSLPSHDTTTGTTATIKSSSQRGRTGRKSRPRRVRGMKH